MPEGRRPRGATPHSRSGAAAESARLQQRRNGRQELPCIRGQWGQPEGATPRPKSGVAAESARLQQHRSSREELTHIRGQGWQPGGATTHPRPGAAAGRSYPTPEVRGGSREKQPHFQGAVAMPAQEGPEELLHL